MYVSLNITKWKGHVGAADNGSREFVINPTKISELRADGTGSKFYFHEYALSRRDSPSYVEAEESVQTIIDARDVTGSLTTTLPVYRNNDTSATVENLVILTDALVYATRYNGSPRDTSWVVIEEGAFKVSTKKVLVALSVEDILTGTSQLVDYDGNGYTTVTIGNLEWTVENFRVTHYADGTAITNLPDPADAAADVTGSYSYYNNDEPNYGYMGLLYNWYAVTNIHVFPYLERNGVQEAGWRVPTSADFLALLAAVGNDDLTAGGLLKETGLVHWDAPNPATDAYGFKWISGGNRFIDEPLPLEDGFESQGIYGDLWSATEEDATTAHSCYTYYDDTEFYTLITNKLCGMNVRLCRDV